MILLRMNELVLLLCEMWNNDLLKRLLMHRVRHKIRGSEIFNFFDFDNVVLRRLIAAAFPHSDDFFVKLFGDSMLDAVVLGDDPLVVVLVRTTRKRTRVPRFAFRKVSGARDEGEHSISEMFLDQMLVKIEGSGSDHLDIVAHQTLNTLLSILLSRVRLLLFRRQSNIRITVIPFSTARV